MPVITGMRSFSDRRTRAVGDCTHALPWQQNILATPPMHLARTDARAWPCLTDGATFSLRCWGETVSHRHTSDARARDSRAYSHDIAPIPPCRSLKAGRPSSNDGRGVLASRQHSQPTLANYRVDFLGFSHKKRIWTCVAHQRGSH